MEVGSIDVCTPTSNYNVQANKTSCLKIRGGEYKEKRSTIRRHRIHRTDCANTSVRVILLLQHLRVLLLKP